MYGHISRREQHCCDFYINNAQLALAALIKVRRWLAT